MNIIVVCDTPKSYDYVSKQILLGICDHVNVRTRFGRRVFEINEKDIMIGLFSAKGEVLRELQRIDFVLFYDTNDSQRDEIKKVMIPTYLELKSLDELIQLVTNGWIKGILPSKSGSYVVRYNGREGRDDFTVEGNYWWATGDIKHPEEVEWKPGSFRD